MVSFSKKKPTRSRTVSAACRLETLLLRLARAHLSGPTRLLRARLSGPLSTRCAFRACRTMNRIEPREYSMRGRCFKPLFHAWERRLASVTKDRVVRPFEWGLDWIPPTATRRIAPPDAGLCALGDARDGGHRCVLHAAADDRLQRSHPTATAIADVSERARHAAPENNTVYCRLFPRARSRDRRGDARQAQPRCSCCRSGTPTPAATSACAGCSR